jgi:hypothetical protein
MDFLDICIYFVNIFNISIVVGLLGLILSPILIYIFGINMFGFFSIINSTIFYIFTTVFPNWTIFLYLLINIFFIIMYVIYLIIIYIIPETGIATLFIPVRELLLAIPPLPSLIDKGVFPFFTSIIKLFGVNDLIQTRLQNFSIEYFHFSKGTLIALIELFNPHLDMDKVIEKMQNNNKEAEINFLKKDVDICIKSNANITTPDMGFVGGIKNSINDINNTIKCNLKSIGPYINAET